MPFIAFWNKMRIGGLIHYPYVLGMTSIVTDYNIECSWTLNSLIQNGGCQWLFNAPKRRLKKKKFGIYHIEVFICFANGFLAKIMIDMVSPCLSGFRCRYRNQFDSDIARSIPPREWRIHKVLTVIRRSVFISPKLTNTEGKNCS